MTKPPIHLFTPSPALLFLLAFLFGSGLHAQWPSFDVSSAVGSNFTDKTTPYFSMISSEIGSHPFVLRSADYRFRAGVSYHYYLPYPKFEYAQQQQGGLPFVEGTIIVTSNLALHGVVSTAAQSTGSEQSFIHIQGWGFRLFLTDTPGNDWSLSTRFSTLNSPKNYRLTTLDTRIDKEWQISTFHLRTGLGSNTYKATITMDEENVPSMVRGYTPYFSVGAILRFQSIVFAPDIRISGDGVQLTLSLQKGFH